MVSVLTTRSRRRGYTYSPRRSRTGCPDLTAFAIHGVSGRTAGCISAGNSRWRFRCLAGVTAHVPHRSADASARVAGRPGDEPDRQILVAGDDLAGVVTAAFLEQAGLDPVLAPTASDRSPPSVRVIWQPGLALLERLGVRRPVRRRGRSLDRLARLRADRTWEADSDEPSLVAIDRARLAQLLDAQLRDRFRTATSGLTGLERTSTGVRATFDGRIAEPFDAAVATDRSLVRGHERRSRRPVHTWTFEWPGAPETATEAWDATRAAFVVPTAGRGHVRVVATGPVADAAAVSPEGVADQFERLFDTDLRHALDRGFEYRRVDHATPLRLQQGSVALVGEAARATLPGSHLGAALDIESAWTVADAIAYGPRSVVDALESYERRRRHRSTRLWGYDDTRPARSLSPPLRQLSITRRLAFSHAVDGAQPALARDVPESL